MSEIKHRLHEATKQAMREKEKQRLLTLRSIQAMIKQQEVDTRSDVDDTAVLAILDKMSKQRRESITQFSKANRNDLVEQEELELAIIQEFLPEPLGESDIQSLIQEAIQTTGASSIKDMGKVMAYIKPKAQGRADMGKISGLIKQALAG